jgi:1,2-diacylglycerol 3-alpha-glucosyltransferase
LKIGFVSTWFERGAAYVTKAYINLLKSNHDIFVYARGGEQYGKGDPNWDFPYVTWAPQLLGTNINFKHFEKWINKNELDCIFFNEQHEIDVIYKLKKRYHNIKVGSYIDYYKENTVNEFNIYDFLICNTKRHSFVFKDHPQSFYVPWGTDTNIFKPINEKKKENLTFFHSAGMSSRKGTGFVVKAFISGEIYKKASLIIHTQRDFEKNFGYNVSDLKSYNIEIIEKTVSAPGLYHLGDVYVYPTMLDGLGLTMYESLACGLPVITTNNPPMNEVIHNDVGRLVDVEYYRSRADAYYWPLSIVDINSLINAMKYYCDNEQDIQKMRKLAREEALKLWQWEEREEQIRNIFENSSVIVKNPSLKNLSKRNKLEQFKNAIGSNYIYTIIKPLVKFIK